METPIRNDLREAAAPSEAAQEAKLNPEQRELLRSLERAFKQAERGETIPFEVVLQKLRMEREAEELANNNGAAADDLVKDTQLRSA